MSVLRRIYRPTSVATRRAAEPRPRTAKASPHQHVPNFRGRDAKEDAVASRDTPLAGVGKEQSSMRHLGHSNYQIMLRDAKARPQQLIEAIAMLDCPHPRG